MRSLLSLFLFACAGTTQELECEVSGAFAIVQTVYDLEITDAATMSEIEPADLGCEQACAYLRESEGEITVDSIEECTWDVDPSSTDTGPLGEITCSGQETEQTCLG